MRQNVARVPTGLFWLGRGLFVDGKIDASLRFNSARGLRVLSGLDVFPGRWAVVIGRFGLIRSLRELKRKRAVFFAIRGDELA